MYLKDCPRAEECPHEIVQVLTQAYGHPLYELDELLLWKAQKYSKLGKNCLKINIITQLKPVAQKGLVGLRSKWNVHMLSWA